MTTPPRTAADLLKAAAVDRDQRPWRYYKLEREALQGFCEQLADRLEAALRAAPSPGAGETLADQLLREEWWLGHGCLPSALYGDDGEMQCSACGKDFKRDTLLSLKRHVREVRMARMAEALAQPPAVSASPATPEFVQAQKDWEPLVRGQATAIANVLNLDASGLMVVQDALNRARIAGYCRAAASAPSPAAGEPAETRKETP